MRLAAGDVVCVQRQRITWVVQLHAAAGQQQGMPSLDHLDHSTCCLAHQSADAAWVPPWHWFGVLIQASCQATACLHSLQGLQHMHTALLKRSWLLVYKYMLDDHGAFSRSLQQLAALLRRSIVRRAAERSDTTPVTPSLTFVHAHSKHSVMKTSTWHALRA